MKNTVEDYIHKGGSAHRWGRGEYKPDLSRCRFSVVEQGRITDWHQCSRKVVENVKGYGFCKQHANEVKTKLGIQDVSGIKYAARFYYREPAIVELSISGETESTIDIISVLPLIGTSNGLYPGKSRKDSQYLRSYFFCDSYNDALLYLYQASRDNVKSTHKTYLDAVETMMKIEGMVSKSEPVE